MTWYKIEEQQVTLHIFAKPNARKTAFLSIGEQGLYMALHALPVKGAANKELISFFAKIFRLPKKQIILQAGEGSKHKRVVIPLTVTTKRFLNDPLLFGLT